MTLLCKALMCSPPTGALNPKIYAANLFNTRRVVELEY